VKEIWYCVKGGKETSCGFIKHNHRSENIKW